VTLDETSGGPRAGFDQNRGFVGLQRRLGPYFALEIGYLNQLVRAQPEVLRHIELLWLGFIW